MLDLIDEKTVKELQTLTDGILKLPDEEFTEEAANVLVEATKGSLGQDIINSSKASLIGFFEKNNYTKKDVGIFISTLQDDFEEYVNSIETDNQNKRFAIGGICDVITDLFLDAAQDYLESKGVEVNFEVFEENAAIPQYAHPSDAGADIYCPKDVIIPANTYGFKVGTGIKMEIPEGWRVMIYPRSGMSLKTCLRMSNSVGVIDANYRGEICVLFDNHSNSDYKINAGDKIAQMVVEKNYQFNPIQVKSVDVNTDRGAGGFGSTGA